ncbi:MAG: PsbP-related protein [Nitrososphaeraceae archaeon]
MTFIIVGSPFQIQSTFALSYSDEGFRPVQLTTTDQKSSGNITSEFTEYVGFDKDFSLQYPSGWTLEPKTNRFEKTDLKMISPEGVTGGVIMIENSILNTSISNVLKEYDMKQKDVEKNLDLLFPRVLSGFASVLEDFNQGEEPNYGKYLIDGHKTGSAEFGVKVSEQDLAGLLVWTMIGNNQFWLVFVASPESFDDNLPLVEKVLDSIKILPKRHSGCDQIITTRSNLLGLLNFLSSF